MEGSVPDSPNCPLQKDADMIRSPTQPHAQCLGDNKQGQPGLRTLPWSQQFTGHFKQSLQTEPCLAFSKPILWILSLFF